MFLYFKGRPVRDKPFIVADWQHILMLNYEVPVEILQHLVPQGFELDLWQGKTFVSIVGVHFKTNKIRGLPFTLPPFSQVNLRCYIKAKSENNNLRGVVFLKEIAPLYRVTMPGRLLFNQPYVTLPVNHQVTIDATDTTEEKIEYSWRDAKQVSKISATAIGSFALPDRESREMFVVERYQGFVSRKHKVLGFKVSHPPWRVRKVEQAKLECDVAAFYGDEFLPYLGETPFFALQAEGGEAAVFLPEYITT